MRKLTYLLGILILVSCATEQREIKKYSIEEFYKNTRISGGIFSEDETRLLVSSDETGIFNLFEINITDGSRSQLTNSTVESFFAVGYLPGTSQVLYTADKGGNEITHIYLLNEDGSSTDLTPAEKENASFAGWSKDKKAMYYISNKRDPRFFDLYKMFTTDWKPIMLYENNDGMFVAGMSEDENILALQKPITTSNIKLFLYNRTTKSLTEISSDD